jgi:hypothetical protein
MQPAPLHLGPLAWTPDGTTGWKCWAFPIRCLLFIPVYAAMVRGVYSCRIQQLLTCPIALECT